MVNKKVDRAAQFLPFDALKGLQEELRAREEKRSRVERKELSDERKEEMSSVLMQVQKGSVVEIIFYRNGHYYELQGSITLIDYIYKFVIIGQEKIYFDNLYQISLISV